MIPTLLALLACTDPPPLAATDDSGLPWDSGDSGDTGEAPDGCFARPPALEIGTGETHWEPLDDPGEVTMVHGPQGGWHMLASARLTDTDPVIDLTFTVSLAGDGAIVAENRYTLGLMSSGPCEGYYPGMYAYLDVSELAEGERDTPPELLSGRILLLRMQAVDESGREAMDERLVIARADPEDEVDPRSP